MPVLFIAVSFVLENTTIVEQEVLEARERASPATQSREEFEPRNTRKN